MTISEGYFQARGGWNHTGGLMGMAYRGEIVPTDMEEMPMHAAANEKVKFHGSDDKPDVGGTAPCCNVVLDDKYYVEHDIEPPRHKLPPVMVPFKESGNQSEVRPDTW